MYVKLPIWYKILGTRTKELDITLLRGLRNSLLLTLALLVFSGCSSPPDPAIARTAADFLMAEASSDCRSLQRLTVPSTKDPCANLGDRAFRLSMMEASGRWRTSQDGETGEAVTTLGGDVEIKYSLKRVNDVWYVLYP